MRLLSISLCLAAGIAMLPLSSAFAGITTYFVAVEAGQGEFTSQSSADLLGKGFLKLGVGLNEETVTDSSISLVPAKCAMNVNGFNVKLVGALTYLNNVDRVNFNANIKLCPDSAPGTYSGSGTVAFTDGDGKLDKVKGSGIFEGEINFNTLEYRCLLTGILSY
jgi:hypothetical protein